MTCRLTGPARGRRLSFHAVCFQGRYFHCFKFKATASGVRLVTDGGPSPAARPALGAVRPVPGSGFRRPGRQSRRELLLPVADARGCSRGAGPAARPASWQPVVPWAPRPGTKRRVIRGQGVLGVEGGRGPCQTVGRRRDGWASSGRALPVGVAQDPGVTVRHRPGLAVRLDRGLASSSIPGKRPRRGGVRPSSSAPDPVARTGFDDPSRSGRRDPLAGMAGPGSGRSEGPLPRTCCDGDRVCGPKRGAAVTRALACRSAVTAGPLRPCSARVLFTRPRPLPQPGEDQRGPGLILPARPS